jgi:flagellum-specific ATP synthase
MDSLTRFAQAQREIALAIGEPPATKGYPPSVFARLPQLVERAGNGADNAGSITAVYTVLVEGDDHADPIADAARAILDGHIVLSRQLAETGIYPAIDIESSISRLTPQITTPEHMGMTQNFKHIYSLYQQNRDLISVGAYQQGSDPAIDRAIRMHPQLIEFITQNMNHSVSFDSSRTQLAEVLINTGDDERPVAVDTPVDQAADMQVDQPLSGELVG